MSVGPVAARSVARGVCGAGGEHGGCCDCLCCCGHCCGWSWCELQISRWWSFSPVLLAMGDIVESPVVSHRVVLGQRTSSFQYRMNHRERSWDTATLEAYMYTLPRRSDRCNWVGGQPPACEDFPPSFAQPASFGLRRHPIRVAKSGLSLGAGSGAWGPGCSARLSGQVLLVLFVVCAINVTKLFTALRMPAWYLCTVSKRRYGSRQYPHQVGRLVSRACEEGTL